MIELRAPLCEVCAVTVDEKDGNRVAVAAVINVQPALRVLKEALLPSQREAAADSLCKVDWKVCPQVVDALMSAAKEDPAATVRASCVRCLVGTRPATETRPRGGTRIPVSILTVVDLPAPFGPM